MGSFVGHPSNIPNNSVPYQNPEFVDPNNTDKTKLDFHVKQISQTLKNGQNGSDIGAFGGSGADTIPFPVDILSVVPSDVDPTTATVTWTPNLAFNVTNSDLPGTYVISYTELATDSTQTILVPAPEITTDITGLIATPPTPSAPTLSVTGYSDSTIDVSWSPGAAGATGYILHYIDTVTGVQTDRDVKNLTQLTLGGLINYRPYDIWVTPYAQAVYTFAVFVRDNSSGPFTPGASHESIPSPAESLTFGDPVTGPDSNIETEFPEAIQPTPNLPKTGCFIATAAYGYYSAPQVQILRDFRDRYLVTNEYGRAFVDWYYRYGPIGAAYINEHPWLKPAVRAALLPLIGIAFFMLETSLTLKLAVMLCSGLFSTMIMKRKYSIRSGGAR